MSGPVSPATDKVQLRGLHADVARRWGHLPAGPAKNASVLVGRAVRACMDGRASAADVSAVEALAASLVNPNELRLECRAHPDEVAHRVGTDLVCWRCDGRLVAARGPDRGPTRRRRGSP